MANVTKKEIVEEISRRTGMTQAETKMVFESLLEAIAQSLRAGRNIELRGFGRFKVRSRKARTARNPRTGEVVEVPGGLKPVFEASKELRDLLNAPDHDLEALQKVIGGALSKALVESAGPSEE
jgi:DNA-binding protein HU-beta/integration host factor subunit beta